MFWVSGQRLVDLANTIRRNSWMSELETEELERNLAENIVTSKKKRVNDTGNNLREVRYFDSTGSR